MKKEYNTIDLFSGCGGLTLGFSRAGFNCILGSDIDENCEKTFAYNFPDTPFLCKDIQEISKQEIDEKIGNKPVDVIIGGPPCQGFSLANKRRNKIKDDPRNKLFYDFVKVIGWYEPIAFVFENVKGILSMQNGKVIQQIIYEFEHIGPGYVVDQDVLKASDFGVPQNRERVILIGIRSNLHLSPRFPTPLKGRKISVNSAISDLPHISSGEGSEKMPYQTDPKNAYQSSMRKNATVLYNHVAMKHTTRLIERFKAIKPGENLTDVWETHGAVKRGKPSEKSEIKFSQNNQRLIGCKPAPTIAASFQSNFIHPTLHRNFTAREGARLQSFPDTFVFQGMRTKMSWEKGLSQYQQIGNAVPPLLAYHIAKELKKTLNSIK